MKRLSFLLILIIYFTKSNCFVIGNPDLVESLHRNILIGGNTTIICKDTNENTVWLKNNKPITGKTSKRITILTTEHNNNELESEPPEIAQPKSFISFLQIHNVTFTDTGNYTCINQLKNENKTFFMQSIILPKIVRTSPTRIKTKEKSIELYCTIQMFPIEYFNKSILWTRDDTRDDDLGDFTNLLKKFEIKQLNQTHINVTLRLTDLSKKHNGTYTCSVISSPYIEETIPPVEKKLSILILDVPNVVIEYVKAIGSQKIYMNWTVNDGNDPVKNYFLQHMKEGAPSFTYYYNKINVTSTSWVLDGFEPNTNYQFKMHAQNGLGAGNPYTYPYMVKTLETDPSFTPEVEVKGNTHSTITVGWQPPPQNLLEYIQYYELVVLYSDENSTIVKEQAIHPQNNRNLPYMFDNLSVATEYSFKVRACSEYTKDCGNWSEIVNGTTSDGLASEPINLKVVCSHSNITRHSSVSVTWDPPKQPNGKIISYQVNLNGFATFKSENGNLKNETWGPKVKTIDESSNKAFYENVPANTNYTVQVSAMTRTKRQGTVAVANCTMPVTTPDNVGRYAWGKIKTETGNWAFKLFFPRISERNGPICCFKIYLIRLSLTNTSLPTHPEDLEIMTYSEVHAVNNTKGGAYIAEVLPSDHYNTEIYLGDGQVLLTQQNNSNICAECLEYSNRRRKRRQSSPTVPPVAEATENAVTEDTNVSETIVAKEPAERIFDGQLDTASNYTGFVEIMVTNKNGNALEAISSYSEYFQEMNPGAPPSDGYNSNDLSMILNIVIQILCGLMVIVLLLLMTLCLLHKHYSKNLSNGDEAISLRDSLRAFCHGRNSNAQHRHLIGTNTAKPPILPPISKDDLPQAFIDRHKDSDYGFQHEFELLPDRFNDRTSKNSDAKENLHKNRYPDIKSYDQTRVKLSTINSIIGSDYINANFVIGYKERKKFICAQGPMDSTVNDFWRMIWEQHLEIIVMLTNLEEYNKTKCAKYWPEKINDAIQYGDINVLFQSDYRYSDYLVRNLKITKRISQSSGDDTEESRNICQYHYLAWKDFMAPEHPQGLTKFIKQINSVYTQQRGPILVHCSAGVGRTGTLVALDNLTQQLDEEGQVSIFNTVCDMRYQRNFLVQSLKQYIFLYKALTDTAMFGDTDIELKYLSTVIESMKQKPNNDENELCKLEKQYEKICNIKEDIRKTTAIGGSEENKVKNRSELTIPFDKNRVILAPIPGRDNSTFINASFVEGYDNHESFIIAQDPLENTISDFWRMISEQGIDTIVMLSEIGDMPKCPRYWADEEIQYDNLIIKYIQSESCPYYTRREFTVTNIKMNDIQPVTQFQYHGWPTVEGEVPEVTRGMIEIVNQTLKHHSDNNGPMVVHCTYGSDRSSIFVAMCILVQQLRCEKRVDVCSLTRKLRAQRNLMIDTYAQYEFLHRAIVNYADLYPPPSSPTSDC
uniref:protein-tyrosine-phosphatase n=1 Tax=Corethrella appendiculata TaxID=1370023 RepID=W4VRM2_9DIPT